MGCGTVPGICEFAADAKNAIPNAANTAFLMLLVQITVLSPRSATIPPERRPISKRFSSILLHTNMSPASARPLETPRVPKFHGRAGEARNKKRRGPRRSKRQAATGGPLGEGCREKFKGGWHERNFRLRISWFVFDRATRCVLREFRLGASAHRAGSGRPSAANATRGANSARAEASGRRPVHRR